MAVHKQKKQENKKQATVILTGLARDANKYHQQAYKHCLGMAENARNSGEALNKARSYGSWKRGGWKKWLEDNFGASYETAKVYMRIAKQWDDPRLTEARRLGVTLNSINKILQVLKDKKSNIEKTEVDMCRDEIRKMFTEKLQTELSKDDIVIIAQDKVFEYLWDKLYPTIRKTVCGALDYDPYQYEKNNKFHQRYKDEKKMQRKARERR